MSRRLRTFVHIQDEEGRTHLFGPDSDIPQWAADKIDNPKAWSGQPDAQPGRSVETVNAELGGSPPRQGPGSGKDAWKTYADSLGIAYADDATRDDIIAAVELSTED